MKIKAKSQDIIYHYHIENNHLCSSSNPYINKRWKTVDYIWEIQDYKLWMFNKSRSMGMCFGEVLGETE